ncbi:MAG: hypothetical protein JMDDDDMK_05518 [Acidobacteria bacterium]|nr:hypothetical protein [Acidobacteriota bacterium]
MLWVRVDSTVLLASNPFPFNTPFAESTLEAIRPQGCARLGAKQAGQYITALAEAINNF